MNLGIKMRTLGSVCEDRNNGFNFLRILAATGILVAHCMLVVPVYDFDLPKALEDFAFGADLLLSVFFVFSGFLITASLERNQNIARFAVARILRIFPGLIVVSLLLVFLVGPIMTSLPMAHYFAHAETWFYFPMAAVFLDATASLPGLFEKNPVAGAINIPVWTLRYEVIIYAMFPFLFIALSWMRANAMPHVLAILLLILIAVKLLSDTLVIDTSPAHLVNFTMSFLTGSLIWIYRHRIPNSIVLVIGLWVLFGLSSDPDLSYVLGVFAAGFMFIWLAFIDFEPLRSYNSFGDYSYGTYIIHFPVAQIIFQLLPAISPVQLSVLTIAVTLPLAILLWRYVESPSLSMVKSVSYRLSNYLNRWSLAFTGREWFRSQIVRANTV
ncbi:MAG: acyltransferase family protein [Rhizobiaceae bacterium]